LSKKWNQKDSCPGCGFRYQQTIEEIVNDLKGMKNELGTDYFDFYIKKWGEKLQ